MIRFCDKEVYNIVEGDMTRTQILMFFLQEETNRLAVIVVYRKDGSYKGIITYRDLLIHGDLEESINMDTMKISKNFWEEAESYFERGGADGKLLAVLNESGNILGFAYNDDDIKYVRIKQSLIALETMSFFMPKRYHRVLMVVITDLNELAWRCNNLFAQRGYEVCVIGEKWEWFGFKSGEGYLNHADYEKLYIYAEGTHELREEGEFSKYKFADVFENFYFIEEIASINAKSVYEKELERVAEKGAVVCECSIPIAAEIQKRTLEEEQSIVLKLNMADYLANPDSITNAEKECLWNIYGRENVLIYKENGNENKIDMIPLGEFQGRALKGYKHNKRCYLLGPCIAAGYGCLEEDTLCGQLQKLVDPFEYRVIAVSIPNRCSNLWGGCIGSLPVREKDIVLSINHSHWCSGRKKGVNFLDLKPIYEDEKRKSMFCQDTLHTNPEGNRLIAEEIVGKYLIRKAEELSVKESNNYMQKGELLNQYGINTIKEYVNRVRVSGEGKTGSIVMNCNPFTRGHRHLIEYAAAKVDRLYIFVVEEDRSYFKFEDRFAMVKEGTKDIPNVIVAPSGDWVLSYKTMPIYFGKEEMQEMQVDANLDLEIFARYIAPQLGITKRFVGEEPLDKVTRQYNEQMREILLLFDIEVEEIPRMRIQDEVVSASRVREYIKEDKWEQLSRLVPESTYEICREYRDTNGGEQ